MNDLRKQYQEIEEQILPAVQQVLASGSYAGGPFVQQFEQAFAAYHNRQYCVGVNSGTKALFLMLRALDIGPGDEVIVPANTFFATAEAVSLCGATPVFVDCDHTYGINIPGIQLAIGPRTKAIIPVHLYGYPVNIPQIRENINSRSDVNISNIKIIEDCAQSVGARWAAVSENHHEMPNTVYDYQAGSMGDGACYSFYPSKNLGACGEAGAILTDDQTIYERLLTLRNHGSTQRYYHDFIGSNGRMDGIQAAVLQVKLGYIDEWNNRRNKIANLYRQGLLNIPQIILPPAAEHVYQVYHLFVIQAQQREQLRSFLQSHDVETAIHYPIPCHLQQVYTSGKAPFRVVPDTGAQNCEQACHSLLSLPMHEQLTCSDAQRVVGLIQDFYSGYKGK